MAFGDSDLAAIFADFGTPVTWKNVTATGILDVYSDVFEHGGGPGGFETTEYYLRVPQPALGGVPKPYDTIVIPDGPNLPPGFEPGSYTIRSLPKCQDLSIIDMILKGPVAA